MALKKRSIIYKWAWVYKTMLKVVHGENLKKRYQYMSQQIGNDMSVLEPGAGPGIIPQYLGANCTYSGFDINKQFVDDAKKRRIDIKLGNMMDAKMYKPSDAVLLVDVIHHLSSEHQKTLLKNVVKAAKKKIVICEPYKHSLGSLEKIPGVGALHAKYFKYIEMDGNNEADLEHIHSLADLKRRMTDGFGAIPTKYKKTIKQMGDDLMVTYEIR